MGEHTNIAWCDHTFSPWRGCAEVSPACLHCYARAWADRWGKNGLWGPRGRRQVASPAYWRGPLAWDRAAAVAGRPALVFCGSLCDVFEDRPDLAEPRARLWDLIERTPNLIWLVLTKRSENIGGMIPKLWTIPKLDPEAFMPPNVWLGVTAENQAMADLRIPYLLGRTATVRFVSCEPLLGPIDLRSGTGAELLTAAGGIGWVIVGGESGPGRREMDLGWAGDLQAQCHRAGIPFFMKQDGGYRPGERGRMPDDLWERAFPAAARREPSPAPASAPSACLGGAPIDD